MTPPGLHTRPTSDRLRQSIFNILTNAAWSPIFWPETNVIDAFAGSGAMGFEALSRGAHHVLFFDVDCAAQKCLAENSQKLGFTHLCHIVNGSVLVPLHIQQSANLVFIDPPYNKGLVVPALIALDNTTMLTQGCIAVIEIALDESLITPAGWIQHDQRSQAKSKVVFWQKTGPPLSKLT